MFPLAAEVGVQMLGGLLGGGLHSHQPQGILGQGSPIGLIFQAAQTAQMAQHTLESIGSYI
ncbi:hypothetical protein [Burkholderia diffusa]|uniref:hypothetical protein n=1 Tax=Burkholderia diffusa TaxID=488732 RepID=UPI000B207A5C|nr:hypothetical protein [Burkholderia diffusa]